MRLQQITKEDRLDEFVPIAVGAIITGLTAYFAVAGAYDIWKILEKAEFDPDNMTDDDWLEVTWEVLPVFIPALGKYLGKAVKAVTPLRVRRKIALWVKRKMSNITGGFKKDRPKNLKDKKKPGLGSKVASTLAKGAAVAYGTKKGLDYIKDKELTGAGTKGDGPGAEYAANREPGMPFGKGAAPGTDWDPLGTMARLNQIYGK